MSRASLFLAFLFFAFALRAGTPCIDCAQQYGTVLAYAIVVTNQLESADSDLQTCIYRNNYIADQVRNIRDWYSGSTDNMPSAVSYSCANIENYTSQNNTQLSSLRQQVSTSRSAALSQISTLDSFSCSCSTGSCGCVSILNDIYLSLTRIENGVVDNVASMKLTLDNIDTNLELYLLEIYNRLTLRDDDYYQQLNAISSAIASNVALLPTLAGSVANDVFAGDNVMSDLDLGIGYLYSASYQNMVINRRSNDVLHEILNVISNIEINVTNSNSITSRWDADLAFISNYLWNIQRQYFQSYQQYKNFGVNNYLLSDSDNMIWQVLTSPTNSRVYKSSTYNTKYQKKSTNWFERIEFLLQGLNGFYDVSEGYGSSMVSASSVTNNYIDLLESTNSFLQVTGIFSVSNQAATVVNSFVELANSFNFGSSTMPSATLTLCPSFNLGSFEFSGIAFEMYDISEVLEVIRTAMQFIWIVAFCILGAGLAVKFFYHLGMAIRDVFIILKTLL